MVRESTADALLARLAKEQADERAPSVVAGKVRIRATPLCGAGQKPH